MTGSRIFLKIADHLVGFVFDRCAAERFHHRSVLRLHVIERERDSTQGVRHRQHPQGVTRRCGVHHDDVVGRRSSVPEYLEQGGELVDAGKRQSKEFLDVRLIEPGPPERNGFENRAPGAKPAFQRAHRADFERVQGAPVKRNGPWGAGQPKA